MKFSQLARSPLYATILSAIRTSIISGKLRPGDHLGENEIAKQMGVSRAPVREAIRRLEQEGLVESVPFRGVHVADVSEEDLDEIYQVRAMLEGYAIRRVATRLEPQDIALFQHLLETMRDAAMQGDLDLLVATDLSFHEEILRLSGSRLIQRVWAAMDGIIRSYTNTVLRLSRRRDIITYTAESHAPVVKALLSRDPVTAEQAIRIHILETRHLINEERKETIGLLPDEKS